VLSTVLVATTRPASGATTQIDATGYGPLAPGQACRALYVPSVNTSRQCNVPWSLVNTYTGGLGSLSMDCDVTLDYTGTVYLEWWNGGAYARYDNPSSILKTQTMHVNTGTRIVTEARGANASGYLVIKSITHCGKPANGTDFLLVNPTYSKAAQKLACATSNAKNNTMTLAYNCTYLDQVRLTEVYQLPLAVRYTMGLPYSSGGLNWQNDASTVWAAPYDSGPPPYLRTQWDFLPTSVPTDPKNGLAGTYKVLSAVHLYPDDLALTMPNSSTSSRADIRHADGSAGQDWMLVPVPYNWPF
jgi:hypothetical protein